MNVKTHILVLSVFVLLCLLGCSQEDSPVSNLENSTPVQSQDISTRLLLNEAMPLSRVEISSEVLPIWRQYSSQKPTLLLMSNDPMLLPAPEALSQEIAELIALSPPEEILTESTLLYPLPLFLPSMTVDVALQSQWFGSIAWAFPLRDDAQKMDVDALRAQLVTSGQIDEREGSTLKVADSVVTGTIREVPLVAATLPHLPPLTGPVVVHIDQSYFQKLYKNEVATPLLLLVVKTLQDLRKQNIPVLAVTFTYGNLDERIPLDGRFLGEFVASFVEHPELFDQPMDINWQRQGDILYLSNFFKKDETRELALAMNSDDPDSAWVKFALYRSAAEHKKGKVALDFLGEAVMLDRVYAVEYLALAEIAYDKGLLDKAMQMLTLAAKAFPDNVQLKLKMARLAADLGEKEVALQLVKQLQQLKWSTIYYPEMQKYLTGFTDFLNGKEVAEPEATPNIINDSRRQRILKKK